MREKIHINGYDYWLDKEEEKIYPSELSTNGVFFMDSIHVTKDEKRQINNYIKYGK